MKLLGCNIYRFRALGMLFLAFVAASLSLHAEGATAVQTLVDDNAKFAFKLYSELSAKKGNIFFSPYSVSTALAMTCAGARGETARQMREVLCFSPESSDPHFAFAQLRKSLSPSLSTGKVSLSVANSIWPQKGYHFLKPYITLLENDYGVKTTPLDYIRAPEAARNVINKWVEKQTSDKIRNLIPSGVLGSSTRLVLTNAIYFKADWKHKFDHSKTRDSSFRISKRKKVKTSMMSDTFECGYADVGKAQLLELSYDGDRFSLVVILPKKLDGLSDLEKTLNVSDFNLWMSKLKKREVIVSIPKFKAESEFRLDKMLIKLGMPDAFLSGKADFSGMDGGRDLFISAVLHKAYVNVDEKGSEAAAATANFMMADEGLDENTPIFIANHPFFFLIREKTTGTILFIGRLINPLKANM